jgi:hypothetical protein
MGRYLTHARVFNRFSRREVIDIYDDEQDGGWKDALDQAIAEAESVIEDSIRKTYGETGVTTLRQLGTNCPDSVWRLCLDELSWRMGTRHPGYTNAIQWDKWHESILRQLKELRLRDIELTTNAADEGLEPAVNEGGIVESGNPDDTTPKEKVFLNGMGDFWQNPDE